MTCDKAKPRGVSFGTLVEITGGEGSSLGPLTIKSLQAHKCYNRLCHFEMAENEVNTEKVKA